MLLLGRQHADAPIPGPLRGCSGCWCWAATTVSHCLSCCQAGRPRARKTSCCEHPCCCSEGSEQQKSAPDTAAYLGGIAKAKAVEWRADPLLYGGGQQRHVCSSTHKDILSAHPMPFYPGRPRSDHTGRLRSTHSSKQPDGLQLSATEGVLQLCLELQQTRGRQRQLHLSNITAPSAVCETTSA